MIKSEKILMVGPEFSSPKGGVAQCLYTYNSKIFSRLQVICNSCAGSFLKKLYKIVVSIVKYFTLLVLDKKIKIVHIHTASYNSFRRSALFVKMAKIMGRKVIIHIHGGGFKEYYSKEKEFVNSVLRKCDVLITLSDSWKQFFQKEVAHKCVYVVPNIIDAPILLKKQVDGKFHLLFLGQILQAKGIFDLVEVLAENNAEYKENLVLDIGGGLFEEERLVNFIRQNNLENLIRFHGWLSGEKKVEMLNLADAFILPSYTEGVPISILEAESYGLPILSTYVGGIPEIVSDGSNGYLFKPGDKIAMKQAIDKLLFNPKKCKQFGEKSKKRAVGNLPKNVEKQLSEIYIKLLEY